MYLASFIVFVISRRDKQDPPRYSFENMDNIPQEFCTHWWRRGTHVGQGMGLHVAVWPNGTSAGPRLVTSGKRLAVGSPNERFDLPEDP